MNQNFLKLRNDIKKILSNKPFEERGYLFSDKHFGVGRQLHGETYYYIKDYFQNSKQAQKLANLFSYFFYNKSNFETNFEENSNTIDSSTEGNITLIGVDIYTELFIFEAADLLQKKKERKVNFCFIDDSHESLRFFSKPYLSNYILLVVPVTHALERLSNFTELILSVNPLARIEVCVAFLITDNKLKIENQKYPYRVEDIEDKNVRSIYKNAGWRYFTQYKVELDRKLPGELQNHSVNKFFFLVNLDTNIFAAEKCCFCFPQILSSEVPLFPVRLNHKIPNVIFRYPLFKNSLTDSHPATFAEVFCRQPTGHLFGQFSVDDNSYLHYIQRDVFYRNNKELIINFFNEKFCLLLKDKIKITKVLVVTQTQHLGSEMLNDLFFKSETFSEKKHLTLDFIYVNPHEGFIENFITDCKRHIDDRNSTFIVFFDFLISACKHFKIISDFLKSTNESNNININPGFDVLFSIIDRTNSFSKVEILRKLDSDIENAKLKAFSFFKLNVPMLDALNSHNPIKERNKKLKEILEDSNLDSLKISILNNYEKGGIVSLEELEKRNSNFSKIIRLRNLLKLHIEHELSGYFFDNFGAPQDHEKQFSINNLYELLEKTIVKLNTSNLYNEISQRDITDLIVKALSYPLFSFYKNIYLAVFKYVILELEAITEQIAANGYLIDTEEQKRRLEFYIKRSVVVNSNFLISYNFIFWLKKYFKQCTIIEENKKRKPYLEIEKPFILRCYKELIFKNAPRSIRMEELMNSSVLMADPISHPELFNLERALKDQFYFMGRNLKTENIYVLKKLKERFIKFTKAEVAQIEEKSIANGQVNKILERIFSEEFIQKNIEARNFYDFFKKSKHKSEDEKNDILESVKSMLRTTYLIERGASNNNENTIRTLLDIVKEISKIFGSNIDCCLCINYATDREREAQNIIPKEVKLEDLEDAMKTDKILTIYPDGRYRNLIIQKTGLIYNMIEGLYARSGQNTEKATLQTLLGLAREGNSIFSFTDQFYTKLEEDGLPDESKDSTIKPSSLLEDFTNGDYGIIDAAASIILLLRLAELEDKNHNSKFKGRAVFIAYSTEPNPDVKQVTDMLNSEKVRLLLLIKHDLSIYLQKLFSTNTFFDIIHKSRIQEIEENMEHGVTNYFRSLEDQIEQEKLYAAKKWKSRSERKGSKKRLILIGFLKDWIHRHFNSRNESPDFEEHLSTKYTAQDITDYFEGIMDAKFLSRNRVPAERRRLHLDVPHFFQCPSDIFEQVVPELIVNMKKYSCLIKDRELHYYITFHNNSLIFKNPYYNIDNSSPHKNRKYKGGLQMSNTVLRKYKLKLKDPFIENGMFCIELPLPKEDK